MMTEQQKQLRAWLYHLLAQIEETENVEATRTEDASSNHIKLDIQFRI